MRSGGSWLGQAGVVLTGGFGLLVLSASVFGDGPVTGPVVTGLVLLSLAVGLWVFLRPPRPEDSAPAVSERPDGPEVRIRLRPHVPAANLLVFGALALLLGYGVLAIGLGEGGLLLLPLLLLVALPLPDTVRALLRRPEVTLTTRRVALRGWGADSALDWEDVAAVDLVVPHRLRPVVRICGRAGAESWEFTPRRIFVPLDTRPGGPHVDVRLQALANPGAFQVVVEELAAAQAHERAAFLRETAAALLREDLRGYRTSSGITPAPEALGPRSPKEEP